MSGISSSVGLISGLPTADLISQLMAIEARPLELLQERAGVVQAERTAFVDLSARLLSLKNAIQDFDEPAFFKKFRANSSNSDVLSAVPGSDAALGSFSFQVHSLVASHGLISQGFADADTSPVGSGTVTLEMGNGLLNPATDLDVLNGGEGVRRGTIEITDRAGNTAEVDLTAVLTVQDVVQAINSQTAINVQAGVSGDKLVLTDLNETALAGSLSVRDLGSGHAAEDLGIATSVSGLAGDALSITGADVINLVESTLLASLNDGNGVGRALTGTDFTIQRQSGDGFRFDIALDGNIGDTTHLNVLNNGNGVRLGVIRITDRSGESAEVDLSNAVNLGDVTEAIEASGLDISVTYFNSSSQHALQLSDQSTGDQVFKIEDVSGFAARDLGIAAEADEDSGSLIGNGIHRVTTIGDIMRAVQYAYDENSGYNDGRVRVEISSNGNGLELTSLGMPREFEVIAGEDSTAAADLGLLGDYSLGYPSGGAARDLIAGLNSVLLRSLSGGSGVSTGQVQFTDGNGAGATVDFAGAQTVQDIIDRINTGAAEAGVQVTAAVNPVGNGIIVRDESGSSANPLVIDDVSGTLAAELGLAGTHATGQANSGNLQLQYISEQTPLSELNSGRGVRTGEFNIFDSAGTQHFIRLTDNQKTVGDVLHLINSSGNGLLASINESGDGILITDTADGSAALKIEERDGGFTAADLNLLGEAAEGETTIDGSFEVRLEIDADDTLQDVANKINALGGDYSAAVVNDGSPAAPYRLSVSSLVSGLRGRMVFDSGDTGLALENLVEARDAVVFLGGSDAENPVVLRSPTNTLNNVLQDVAIDLVGTSDEPVDLSITQDVDTIVGDIKDFVDRYNEVIGRISELTSFNSETFERGVLFADSTVTQVESRLFRAVTDQLENVGASVSRLSTIGIAVDANGNPADGNTLAFDEAKFREVYANNPEAVEQLFLTEDTGFGDLFDEMLDGITRSHDGLLATKDSSLESQEELINDRIASLQELLDQKQTRLEREFASLETSLAALQDQQTSLGLLQGMLGG